MISVTRWPEPDILRANKERWLAIYLKSRESNPKLRPPSKQYGHSQIREMLISMSFGKCFYCERKIKDTTGEVDHYIEVAESPELAFEWSNLYLSCLECNRKKYPNTTIPVSGCLNPCEENPTYHLTFEDKQIRPLGDSLKGAKTIQKYQLDRGELDHLRVKQLQQFHRLLDGIRKHQIQEGRQHLEDQEKEVLKSFAQPDHAFSLMFSVYITKLDL